MKCKHCDNKVIEGIRFCLKCGADVETSSVKHCSSCGHKLIQGVNYCLKCGDELNKVNNNEVAQKTIIVQEKINDKVVSKSRLDVRIFEIF